MQLEWGEVGVCGVSVLFFGPAATMQVDRGVTSEQSGFRLLRSRGRGRRVGRRERGGGFRGRCAMRAHVRARVCASVRRVISDLRAGMPGRQWTTTFKERSEKSDS